MSNKVTGFHKISSETNERYIIFCKDGKKRKRYRVVVSLGKGKQVTVGFFKNIEEAVMARDKYLSSR